MTSDSLDNRTIVTYPPHSSLRTAINSRVRDYFAETGLNRGGGPRMWLKSAIILAWLFASYTLLVFWASTWWQALPLTISLALAVAGVGFNIQHDGGHGAYSRKSIGNRLSASTLDLVGGSSYLWRFKHTIVHHHYTNIQGIDEDIKAEPILRMGPAQKRRWFHRFQFIYMWGLYAFVPPKWVFFDDFVNVIFGRMGARRIPRPRGLDLAIMIGGKIFAISMILVVPMMLHSWSSVLMLYGLYCLVLGVTLATTFQLAHCVEEAAFYEIPAQDERMEKSWVEHQLATTVNFAPRSRWCSTW